MLDMQPLLNRTKHRKKIMKRRVAVLEKINSIKKSKNAIALEVSSVPSDPFYKNTFLDSPGSGRVRRESVNIVMHIWDD